MILINNYFIFLKKSSSGANGIFQNKCSILGSMFIFIMLILPIREKGRDVHLLIIY